MKKTRPNGSIFCRFLTGYCLASSLLALVLWFYPEQGGVILYKATLLCVAGAAGYLLDRLAFPYARPDSYLDWPWREREAEGFQSLYANHSIVKGYKKVFIACLIRRAIIMAACMLALGLAL